MVRELTRRDFLKTATYLAALLGLQSSWIPTIAEALEKKKRPVVIWLSFQCCSGCTESFIMSSHPTINHLVLDLISLDFNETIQAAAGHQAEQALQRSMQENAGKYILIVSGSVPAKDNGVYCVIAGRSAVDIVREAAAGAAAVMTVGTCSSFGGIPAAQPNPTGAVPVSKLISGKPIIRVPGCPPIGEVMTGVVAHYLVFGRLPELDSLGRPLTFFKNRIHDNCYRRKYFDAGQFAKSFEDPNGCLYKLGCKGPTTRNACALLGWNERTSFPIQSGHPCIGCSEPGFWDAASFYRHLPEPPGFGVHTTVDKVGLTAAGAVAAAYAVQGAAYVVKRRSTKDKETASEVKEPEKKTNRD